MSVSTVIITSAYKELNESIIFVEKSGLKKRCYSHHSEHRRPMYICLVLSYLCVLMNNIVSILLQPMSFSFPLCQRTLFKVAVSYR